LAVGVPLVQGATIPSLTILAAVVPMGVLSSTRIAVRVAQKKSAKFLLRQEHAMPIHRVLLGEIVPANRVNREGIRHVTPFCCVVIA
jgi:hypothetical protein